MKARAREPEQLDRQDDLTAGGAATDDTPENGLLAGAVPKIPESRFPNINRHILDTLSDAVRAISFGEVVLRIQDGKIVQMEKTERLRFR